MALTSAFRTPKKTEDDPDPGFHRPGPPFRGDPGFSQEGGGDDIDPGFHRSSGYNVSGPRSPDAPMRPQDMTRDQFQRASLIREPSFGDRVMNTAGSVQRGASNIMGFGADLVGGVSEHYRENPGEIPLEMNPVTSRLLAGRDMRRSAREGDPVGVGIGAADAIVGGGLAGAVMGSLRRTPLVSQLMSRGRRVPGVGVEDAGGRIALREGTPEWEEAMVTGRRQDLRGSREPAPQGPDAPQYDVSGARRDVDWEAEGAPPLPNTTPRQAMQERNFAQAVQHGGEGFSQGSGRQRHASQRTQEYQGTTRRPAGNLRGAEPTAGRSNTGGSGARSGPTSNVTSRTRPDVGAYTTHQERNQWLADAVAGQPRPSAADLGDWGMIPQGFSRGGGSGRIARDAPPANAGRSSGDLGERAGDLNVAKMEARNAMMAAKRQYGDGSYQHRMAVEANTEAKTAFDEYLAFVKRMREQG